MRHASGFTPAGLRDILRIGDQLELVRSGRSIAEAEELTDRHGNDPWRLDGTVKT